MSHTTPVVEAGRLHEHQLNTDIQVGSEEWFSWLAAEQHRCFHFVHPTGGFTARKERKQRWQWYWVAYRQVHCKLHKTYLGKTEALGESKLIEASRTLAQAANGEVSG